MLLLGRSNRKATSVISNSYNHQFKMIVLFYEFHRRNCSIGTNKTFTVEMSSKGKKTIIYLHVGLY